jgi:hypothetical protein
MMNDIPECDDVMAVWTVWSPSIHRTQVMIAGSVQEDYVRDQENKKDVQQLTSKANKKKQEATHHETRTAQHDIHQSRILPPRNTRLLLKSNTTSLISACI